MLEDRQRAIMRQIAAWLGHEVPNPEALEGAARFLIDAHNPPYRALAAPMLTEGVTAYRVLDWYLADEER